MNAPKLSALALLALFAVTQSGPALAMDRRACFNQGNPRSYQTGYQMGYQQGYGFQPPAMQQIRHGIRDGQLTPAEARQLMQGQRQIWQTERKAYADGYISPGERQKIARLQVRESRDIFRQSHDGQVRY